MTTSISMSTPAAPPVASDATVLAACENKMMSSELCAARLVGILKK